VRNGTGDAQDDLGSYRWTVVASVLSYLIYRHNQNACNSTFLGSEGCDIAGDVGAGPSFWKPFVIIWPLGLVVLGIVWLAVRPRAVRVVAPAPTVPQAWYDDPERPGHNRWWDGVAWGIRDDEHPSAIGLPTAPPTG
jgi:hypothetical protein